MRFSAVGVKVLGYHPILATRADTTEVLHIRMRKGSANTQKGMLRFCQELTARVQRAGACGEKLLRADSGFWNTMHLPACWPWHGDYTTISNPNAPPGA
jgi:hypothetical protein